MNAVVQPKEIDISELLGKRTNVTEQVDRAQCTNDEDEGKCNDLLKIIKNMLKMADDDRKAAGEWFRNMLAEINGKYKDEITDPLEKAKGKLESIIKPYALQKLKKRQEEERLAREALEKAAVADALVADPDNAEKILDTAIKASERVHQPTTVRSTYGAVTSNRIVYKFELEDLDLVPREFLMLDESKTRNAINGKSEAYAKRVESIPGIKIIEDVQITSR